MRGPWEIQIRREEPRARTYKMADESLNSLRGYPMILRGLLGHWVNVSLTHPKLGDIESSRQAGHHQEQTLSQQTAGIVRAYNDFQLFK